MPATHSNHFPVKLLMLEREEYIEQAYFFRILGERIAESYPLQELMGQIRHEILATTKLPMAIDYMLSELRHSGMMSVAMQRLDHYFTPYQAYLVAAAEDDRGNFDMRVAIEVLHHEAKYRSGDAQPQGLFMFQFETISRNRLRYDRGLDAMARDPLYDEKWRDWIRLVRRQVGLVDFADLIFLRSEEYFRHKLRLEANVELPETPLLFGEKEGKIAWANREKDPMYLFAALQRHLGYPTVPRQKKIDETRELVPQLLRRVERLETRIKLLEEENRQGIDITRFYAEGDRSSKTSDNT